MQRKGRPARVVLGLGILTAISITSIIYTTTSAAGAVTDIDEGGIIGATAASTVFTDTASTLFRPWLKWNSCWAKGHWRRLNDEEIEAKARLYAYPVAPRWMDNYSWTVQPAIGCPDYVSFDNAGFCAALKGRDVIMIGDSLTGLFSSALMFLVTGRRTAAASPLVRGRFPYVAPHGPLYTGCTDWGFPPSKFVNLLNWAQGHLRLAHTLGGDRSISQRCNATGTWSCTHVVVTPGSPEDRVYGIDEFLTEWAPMHDVQPGVIVINKGAHYDPDNILLSEARAALAFITQTYPNATVIWRNTVPGHVNCSRISVPLSSPQDLSSVNPAWHWTDFAAQNELMRDLILREFPTVVYMDVYTAGILRGDMHVSYFKSPPDDTDCLHYRSGTASPTDHWVEVLYNVLRQLQ